MSSVPPPPPPSAAGGATRPAAPDPGPADADDSRWHWLANVSLTARIVVILCVLLTAALAISAAVTVAFSSRYLVGQVDQQLDQAASSQRTLESSAGSGSQLTDYYATLQIDGTVAEAQIVPQSIARYGRPALPGLSADRAKSLNGHHFTVKSVGGSEPSEWRAVVQRVVTDSGPATLTVALPLAGIHNTVRVLALVLASSAAGVITIGGMVAFWAVRRSLRPLRRIETTAAAIAAGDLSRRVPPAPPSTEIGSLSTSLNAMLSQIEQAFAAREASENRMRQFVSDASHELRTPLATIRGWGELYRMGALDTDDKVEDTMGRIEDAATRMSTLVNDLLALARLDEGRPLRRDRVDVLPLARDAVQDLHALDPTREVTLVGLDGNDPPGSAVVAGDEERLRQVLVNLVGNVARHTPPGTPAQIALGVVQDAPGAASDPPEAGEPPDPAARDAATGRDVVVEVRDHGPGIDEARAGRIFERFYRADSSRTRASGGSGLGLAIVAAIVGAHRGTVSVAATEGGGLTVRVRLPEIR